jgi:tetratricopeptide (TPR) repeat protein
MQEVLEKAPPEALLDTDEEAQNKHGFVQSISDHLLVGSYEQAESVLRAFKEQLGEIPEYFFMQAQVARKKGDLNKAYQILKRLYYEFPVFMMDNRDFETVREMHLLEKIEKTKVHWNGLINLTSQLMLQEVKSSGDRSEDSPNIMIKAQIQDQMEEAMDKVMASYKDVLHIEPLEITALKGLHYCYKERGDIEEAELYKQKVEKAEKYWGDLVQKRSNATLLIAKKYAGEKKFDAAIQAVNLGLVTSPSQRDLLLLKAEILKDLKKFREAFACIDTVLRRYSDEPAAHRIRKEIQAGRLDETLNIGLIKLQEAEQKLPGSDLQKLLRESQECFYEVLDLDPENLRTLLAVYRCQILADNPIKAKKTLQRIKEIDPGFDVEKKMVQATMNPHVSDKDEPCFVATRLFGPQSFEVMYLRAFREASLKTCASGRLFIRWYWRFGPALARLPGKSFLFPVLRRCVHFLSRLAASSS